MLSPRQGQIDALAMIVGRHTLAVKEQLDANGVRVDLETGDVDGTALWAVLVEGAANRRRNEDARARVEKHNASAPQVTSDEDLEKSFPELRWLSKLAVQHPAAFPRAQTASPAERNRALLEDYKDRLEEVSLLFDESASAESLRLWVVQAFERAGLHVVREGRGGATLRLHLPGSPIEVRCVAYASKKKNRNDQVCFLINGVRNRKSGVSWVALHARPFKRIYLIRMEDLRSRFTKKGKAIPKSANVTIRKGSPGTDLFENKIGQLLTEFTESDMGGRNRRNKSRP